jgi:hypothetical protein
MATARPGQSTNRLSAKQPDRIGGVAGEAPFRVFRYAPASPFHLTRYETKQHKPVPSGPAKGINKTNKKLATKKRPRHKSNDAPLIIAFSLANCQLIDLEFLFLHSRYAVISSEISRSTKQIFV